MDFHDFEHIAGDIDTSDLPDQVWWIPVILLLILGPYLIGSVIWGMQSHFELVLSPLSVAPFVATNGLFMLFRKPLKTKVMLAIGCLPLAITLYVWAGSNFNASSQRISSVQAPMEYWTSMRS